ncbi:MAG TPA: hypothetical protein VH054_27680 [Polyangiaceae bacterium]|nr:hypothetical protein [Polyangiaceae bacterium]
MSPRRIALVLALTACTSQSQIDAGSDASALACDGGGSPSADTPYCNRCVAVGDAAPFCADGVYTPSCVGGTWRCVGDLMPLGECVAGGACQFVDASAD